MIDLNYFVKVEVIAPTEEEKSLFYKTLVILSILEVRDSLVSY